MIHHTLLPEPNELYLCIRSKLGICATFGKVVGLEYINVQSLAVGLVIHFEIESTSLLRLVATL